MNLKRERDTKTKKLSEVPPLSIFEARYHHLYQNTESNTRLKLNMAEY